MGDYPIHSFLLFIRLFFSLTLDYDLLDLELSVHGILLLLDGPQVDLRRSNNFSLDFDLSILRPVVIAVMLNRSAVESFHMLMLIMDVFEDWL